MDEFIGLFLFFKEKGYGLAFVIIAFLFAILYLFYNSKIRVLKSEKSQYLFLINEYKGIIDSQRSDFEEKRKEMEKLEESLRQTLKNLKEKKDV